ncbi:MAG: histidine phosphatase family protein [Oscillospiraceae bacterium]
MKLLIIRHAEPDYSIDSLTPKGWKEAELLAARLAAMDISAFYTSPLGRARDTASATLKKAKAEAAVLPWLREFNAPIHDEATGEERIPWDWLPAEWTKTPEFYDKNLWHTVPVMQAGQVMEEALRVHNGLDEILKTHGYQREGQVYRATMPNNKTIAFFCHFGVECVMLGHLLGLSPMVLWHGFCALPSSVTTVITEERRQGIASFRVNAFGDTGHLYAGGEPLSFAARFCEVYGNHGERCD